MYVRIDKKSFAEDWLRKENRTEIIVPFHSIPPHPLPPQVQTDRPQTDHIIIQNFTCNCLYYIFIL